MGRAIALVMLSWLAFNCGQPKQETSSIQEAEYLGAWVGDPISYLEKQGWVVFSVGHNISYCVYGDATGQGIINSSTNCVKQFTEEYKDIRTYCAKQGFTHYGIANLRISHSNVIAVNALGGQVYGHLMVVYGDFFCARKKGKILGM